MLGKCTFFTISLSNNIFVQAVCFIFCKAQEMRFEEGSNIYNPTSAVLVYTSKTIPHKPEQTLEDAKALMILDQAIVGRLVNSNSKHATTT